MPVLLAIDSSPMTDTAVTRRLTRAFVELWEESFPGGDVIHRDLGANPPPHPDALMLGAFAKDDAGLSELEREALRVSDRFVDELLAADVIVIGSPMYNFTVTSALKAWIDLVGRPGRTFTYSDKGPTGLLIDKHVLVVTARGGFYAGETAEAQNDYQETYLRAYFEFLGVEDVRFIHAEGQGIDPDTAMRQERQAIAELKKLFT